MNALLNDAACDEILDEQNRTGKSVRDIIVDGGYLAEDDLLGAMAAYSGSEVVSLLGADIPSEVLRTVQGSVARLYGIMPVEATPMSVTLAISSIPSPIVSDELAFVLSREIVFELARQSEILECISRYYGDDSSMADNFLAGIEEMDIGELGVGEGEDMDENALVSASASAPVVRLVQYVLLQAVNARASDIHFEPFEHEFHIRYRVDGALYEMTPPPKSLALPVISRVKVLSGLNIAERRLPQDGRIQLPVGGRMIDFRVSCLPTQFGESVVLRVLDRSVVSLDLENLGMAEDLYNDLCADIEKPNGIIIVTGPTGSGKTTTLYSCLRRINKEGAKLLTAEEPVEYDIDGIVQVPVNPVQGNTFPLVLRAFLRQDPDIIMIGEIRDLETAQIAIQASLTGHLVFTTLHTNDSAGAVTRLIDMDVPPYLIASTLEAVLGQRLVRTICKTCKTEYEPTPDILQKMSLTPEQVQGRMFSFGAGCDNCNQSGYKGRKGLYEYLSISDPIRTLITERRPTLVIREKARELGMRTMREDGVQNILDGNTTVDEVLRYT
ncbi:MAG: type II/IV secretion system protein [Lentisphaerae bacterium]|nr:type II/IV secretion system protein [Lentisphaerota bacterium]